MLLREPAKDEDHERVGRVLCEGQIGWTGYDGSSWKDGTISLREGA